MNSFPFKIATPEDPYYSRLIGNSSAAFWKVFSKAKPDLSAEFKGKLLFIKDLIEKMLCRYPEDRISLADVLAHPWLKGHSGSHEVFLKHMAT